MSYMSITAGIDGIRVQRVVHPDFNSIIIKIVDQDGHEHRINVVEFDNKTNSHNLRPMIKEEHAYITCDQGTDIEQRARYSMFVPQLTDIDEWEMRDAVA